MDATHHALGADHLPPPAPSAPAPTPACVEDPVGGGRKTPASGPGQNTTPASGPVPETEASTSAPIGLRATLRRAFEGSVWAPVAAKASAIAVGMLGLAAIGAWSTLAGAGVPVNTSVTRASADPQGAWLAPDRGARRPAGVPLGASSPAATPGTTPPVPAPAASVAPDPGPAPGSGVTADGKVVLNTASAEELVKLPRVGPKRAQAIIELRKRLGKFRKPTDLLRVRGIGRKTLVLMLPKLVVDPPAEPVK